MISRSRTLSNLARTYTIVLMIGSFALSGCGPELTTPGKTDISGTWFAGGPAAGMTSVYVTITQASDGSVSGVFTADGTPTLQFCPPNPTCTIAGAVTGTNTVLQVFLDLQNGGLFTGQIIDAHTMTGAMARASVVQPVEFVRP